MTKKRPRTPDGRETSSTPAAPTRPGREAPGRPHPTDGGAIPRSPVHQRIHHDGGTTVYQWPVGSPIDEYLREMMQRQAERFRTKFGRDPGPDDPIFFDPYADQPRPFDPATMTREMSDELRHAGAEAGIDPAFIEAWCELGYVVTEDTQHLFSANEIATWDETVRRHAGDLDTDDDLDAAGAPKKNLPEIY